MQDTKPVGLRLPIRVIDELTARAEAFGLSFSEYTRITLCMSIGMEIKFDSQSRQFLHAALDARRDGGTVDALEPDDVDPLFD